MTDFDPANVRSAVRAAFGALPVSPARAGDLEHAVDVVMRAARYAPVSRLRFPSRVKALADLEGVAAKIAALRRTLERGERLDRRVQPKLNGLTRAVQRLHPATRSEIHTSLLARPPAAEGLSDQLVALDQAVGCASRLIEANGHLHARPGTFSENLAQAVADQFEHLVGRPAAHSKYADGRPCRVTGPFHLLLTAVFEALGLGASAEHEGRKTIAARQATRRMVENRKIGPPIP